MIIIIIICGFGAIFAIWSIPVSFYIDFCSLYYLFSTKKIDEATHIEFIKIALALFDMPMAEA